MASGPFMYTTIRGAEVITIIAADISRGSVYVRLKSGINTQYAPATIAIVTGMTCAAPYVRKQKVKVVPSRANQMYLPVEIPFHRIHIAIAPKNAAWPQ
jgi:hypothetical protein